MFRDLNLNGLDEKDKIGKYSYLPKAYNGVIDIEKMSSEKQLQISQEYTNALKEIMRDAEYKEY